MGGPQAREKEQWMGQVINDFCVDNKYQPESGELLDYVEEILDNEFDTIVEDNSLRIFCRKVCTYCTMVTEGKEAELKVLIEASISRRENASGDSGLSRQMQTLTCNGEQSSDLIQASVQLPESQDSEWTVVSTKRKNNRKTCP